MHYDLQLQLLPTIISAIYNCNNCPRLRLLTTTATVIGKIIIYNYNSDYTLFIAIAIIISFHRYLQLPLLTITAFAALPIIATAGHNFNCCL